MVGSILVRCLHLRTSRSFLPLHSVLVTYPVAFLKEFGLKPSQSFCCSFSGSELLLDFGFPLLRVVPALCLHIKFS